MNGMYTQKPEKVKHIDEAQIKELLKSMHSDNGLNTGTCYSDDDVLRTTPISFEAKHMAYLKSHPKVNPQQYLQNLRTKVRIRK
ncbi:MAG TPA: hypothetical protein VK534_01750 [Methylomirabilota bacterium]|nr:hypothetical protein [Methylomirabilota bacterium]